MDSPTTFGQWLRQRRQALRLTREELARRVGCSVSALRKIEDGERRPSRQIADLLANGLDLPPEQRPTFGRVARGELPLERLAAAAGSAEAAVPPVAARPAPRIHLPPHPTPLIGRQRELVELDRLLRDPGCRLITLVGPGGIGKTRLAAEAAAAAHAAFADGAAFVPLAPLDSARFIVPAIAEALGFAFSSAGPVEPRTQLFNYLQDKQILLVLDNLEHLLPSGGDEAGAVDLAAGLLQHAPQVRLLVTSRETLNLIEEWVFEVAGLPIPDYPSAAGVHEAGAVELFLQRARRAHVGFSAAEHDYPAIVRICRLMNGMPLGIELAAAWVRTLSCHEIAQELERGLEFLAVSARDLPARHRSMRAVFEHSWRLLAEEEQRVLCRLAVFQGGFRREAAEQVAGANLALLSALVAKSLLRRAEGGRYDLHEVIRQFAAVHLRDDPQQAEVRDRHSDFYLNFASEEEQKLKSGAQQAAMRNMSVELDNLRTAWDWGIKRGRLASVGRAVRAYGWFYEVASMIHDGIDQLGLLVQALKDRPRDRLMDKVLGAGLVYQGLLYFRSGRFARAQKLYDDGIAILRAVNEPMLLADALIFSGTIRHLAGNYLEARALIREGLAYAQAANDQWFVAYGIYNLGHVNSLMGEYQKGYEQMLEGLTLWRKIGDPHSISLGLNFLVDTQIKLKQYEEAKAGMLESIALCEQTNNRWGMGTAYRYMGLATLAEGRYVEAQGYFRRSLDIFGEYFVGWDIALSLACLGEATLLGGDPVAARALYLDSLRRARDSHSIPLSLTALMGLAQIESCLNPERAAGWLALVVSHPAATQETRERAARLRAELEKRLPSGVEVTPTAYEVVMAAILTEASQT